MGNDLYEAGVQWRVERFLVKKKKLEKKIRRGSAGFWEKREETPPLEGGPVVPRARDWGENFTPEISGVTWALTKITGFSYKAHLVGH